jgi:hypothetical protein
MSPQIASCFVVLAAAFEVALERSAGVVCVVVSESVRRFMVPQVLCGVEPLRAATADEILLFLMHRFDVSLGSVSCREFPVADRAVERR